MANWIRPDAAIVRGRGVSHVPERMDSAKGTGALRIAIVDDSPPEQYLYPEFVLAGQVFAARGVDAIIADASHLRYDDGRLSADGKTIDLVYNRVTDFAFDQPEHKALQEAYRDGAVVARTGHNHAPLADKRNLSLLRPDVGACGTETSRPSAMPFHAPCWLP